MNNDLGKILKGKRQAQGWALRQLAEQTGVSIAHLARIEKGQRFPSGRVLRKLAKPLGFTEAQLFKLAGFMSLDASDDRLVRIKHDIKLEIINAATILCDKIDSLG